MKYRKFLCMLLAIYVLLVSSAYADHVPGEVIAVFKPNSKFHVQGGRITKTFSALSKATGGTFTVIHSDTISEDVLLEELLARDDVIGASLNRRYKLSNTSIYPNDTLYGDLWGLEAINAPEAWGISTGSQDIYVIVIDSGVDYTHADIQANYDRTHSKNFMSGDVLSDDNGHGTHIAGIIGAIGNNATGITGVNWNTKIISVRIFDEKGSCEGDEILSALNYVQSLLDSDIGKKIAAVNMSFGSKLEYSKTPDSLLRDPQYLAMKAISNTNLALMCVAAGNEATELGDDVYVYPASFVGIDNMIVVAAAANDDNRSITEFTNFSTEYVDMAAPGENILSTIAKGSLYAINFPEDILLNDGQPYMYNDGTSMATPYVSGAAALIKSIFPDISASDIKKALVNGADSNFATDYTKYGFLDVKGALDYISTTMKISDPKIVSYDVPANSTVHENYYGYFTAEAMPPLTWEISSGKLPGGLSIDKDTGTISGVIEDSGTFDFTVKLTDFYGSTSMDFIVTVEEEIAAESPASDVSDEVDTEPKSDASESVIPEPYEDETIEDNSDTEIITNDDSYDDSNRTTRTISVKSSKSSGGGCAAKGGVEYFMITVMLLTKKFTRRSQFNEAAKNFHKHNNCRGYCNTHCVRWILYRR